MRTLFLVVAFVLVSLFGLAQELATVACARGLTLSDCEVGKETVRLALRQLDVHFSEWRWVVVSSPTWQEVSLSLGADPQAPAFTLLATHTSYIEYRLIHEFPPVDEALLNFTKRTGIDRLRWVLAHESGHIFCHTRDEREAEDAGKRIEFGSRKNRTYARVCGRRRGHEVTVAEEAAK